MWSKTNFTQRPQTTILVKRKSVRRQNALKVHKSSTRAVTIGKTSTLIGLAPIISDLDQKFKTGILASPEPYIYPRIECGHMGKLEVSDSQKS